MACLLWWLSWFWLRSSGWFSLVPVVVTGWPQTWKAWNTQGFLWTWKTHGILREFCSTSGKTNFALWVQPVSSNPYAAKCIWCTETVDLSNMGRQALVSHMSSSLCGMTLDIWRSLLGYTFCCDIVWKIYLWLWKTQENSGNFFSYFVATL